MTLPDNLFKIAQVLEEQYNVLKDPQFVNPLDKLLKTSEQFHKSWSGSWLGYHSRVYYASFSVPPPGARFSQEWGMMDRLAARETVGDWHEFRFDDVIEAIKHTAGVTETKTQEAKSNTAAEVFEELHFEILSKLSEAQELYKEDNFLLEQIKKIEKIKVLKYKTFIGAMKPSGELMSRDMTAVQAGFHTPPHVHIIAQVEAIKNPFIACELDSIEFSIVKQLWAV